MVSAPLILKTTPATIRVFVEDYLSSIPPVWSCGPDIRLFGRFRSYVAQAARQRQRRAPSSRKRQRFMGSSIRPGLEGVKRPRANRVKPLYA